jgi:hypothetical protein
MRMGASNLTATVESLTAILVAAASARSTPRSVSLDSSALAPFLDGVRQASVSELKMLPGFAGQHDLIRVSQEHASLLPSEVQQAVQGIFHTENHAATIIRGLPVPPAEKIPAWSPLLHEVSNATAAVLRSSLVVHAAIGSFAGAQYTFVEERGDNLFHLVMPAANVPADSQSSVGANAVNFHTEDVRQQVSIPLDLRVHDLPLIPAC